MIFETTSEAFNYWNKRSRQEIEKRSAEISGIIDSDPDADVIALNIEVDGLREALANKKEIEETNTEQVDERSLNPVTSFNIDNFVDRRADIIETKEYRNAFFKNLLGQEMTLKEKAVFKQAQQEHRSDDFNASSNSMAVLPTETLNEVVSKARKEGGLMSVARAFNIPSNISIPIGTPSSMAKWNTEGQDVERERVSLDSVKFDGYEIIKVFSISNKVKTMSIPAFESYLTDELSNCVMATLSEGLINGSGQDQGTGLLTGITWDKTNSFKTTKDRVEYTDVTKMVAMLKRGYSNGAYFVMNNATLYQYVYGITDNNKRPIFVIDPKSEHIGMLLGFPVIIDDFVPDNVIIFGNPQYMGYNLPQGIAVESSTQSSFTSGKVDYRAMAIADCKPIIPEAFVLMQIKTSDEENVKPTLGDETNPETVEGVSVNWQIKDNTVTIKYKGLSSSQTPSFQLLNQNSAVVAEMADRFTSTKTADSITLTFTQGMPAGEYKVNARVKDGKTYKTVSQRPLTIKIQEEIILTNGVPLLISGK